MSARGGHAVASFKRDDAFHAFCMRRLHGWIGSDNAHNIFLDDASDYGHDAELVDHTTGHMLRLEYKWDRWFVVNLAAEMIAKDRGSDAALGYMFKQQFDWLVYTFVPKGPTMFIFEGQCARKYVFQFWREKRWGATHCPNWNRDRTAAWNLLVPVHEMYEFLARYGMAFKIDLPKPLFDTELTDHEAWSHTEGRNELLALLHGLFGIKLCNSFVPDPQKHWAGLPEYLARRDSQREKFIASQVVNSELLHRDWCRMAIEQGMMRA